MIGDLHGHLRVLQRLLQDAGLLSAGHWSGGASRLLFLGDFFDRGPDGLGCIELVMQLQREAARAGGWVEALIGNHDLLLLAAHLFGEVPSTGPGETFLGDWRAVGGIEADLGGLEGAHVAWLSARPALLRFSETLYLHADAVLYKSMGESVEAVNRAFRVLMAGQSAAAWDALLDAFSEHEAFWGEAGEVVARGVLEHFGAQRLVHAHTPISKLTGQPSATVTAPLVYHGGRCTDVDHELYRGGPGFIYRP